MPLVCTLRNRYFCGVTVANGYFVVVLVCARISQAVFTMQFT
jgi:hypothetical protein